MNYCKSQNARTVLVLTGAEVATATIKSELSDNGALCVEYAYTKGDETNSIIRFYASMDGSTGYPVADDAGNASYTLTATATNAYRFSGLYGYKFFWATVMATGGTPTGTAGATYRYFQRGSQR